MKFLIYGRFSSVPSYSLLVNSLCPSIYRKSQSDNFTRQVKSFRFPTKSFVVSSVKVLKSESFIPFGKKIEIESLNKSLEVP